MGNWVRQFILNAPFGWRWNRSQISFPTLAGQQDYTPVNLALQSQSIGTNPWFLSPNITLGSMAVSDPEGGLTASSFTAINNSGYLNQYVGGISDSASSYTFSVWLQSISTPIQVPLFILGTGTNAIGGVLGAVVVTATTTWQRFSVTVSPLIGQTIGYVQIGGGVTGITPGFLFNVWGAQLEPNANPNAYIPTTTTAVSAVSNFGYLEKASLQLPGGTAQFELELDLNLAQDVQQAQPISISPLIDSNGTITFRLLPVPDQAYTVNINYQVAAPIFVNLTDNWAPIPDYYYNLIQQGFLAKTFEYLQDDRFPAAMSMFVKQVVAANAGMSDTQKNIFMDELINSQREQQSELGNSASGRQGRGLFGQ